MDGPDLTARIAALITEVAERQRPFVRRVCPVCKTPCCRKVHYLFSRTDLCFHSAGGIEVLWRRAPLESDGCWFLGPEGCTLKAVSRPMICHRYICNDLERKMAAAEPRLPAELRETFRVIHVLQNRLVRAEGMGHRAESKTYGAGQSYVSS